MMSAKPKNAAPPLQEAPDHTLFLQIIKLNTPSQVNMFEKVLKWWNGRSLKWSIPVDATVAAAFLTKSLLCIETTPQTTCTTTNSNFVTPQGASLGQDGQRVALQAAGKQDSIVLEKQDGKSHGMRNLVSVATDVALLLHATKGQEPDRNNMPTACYIAFSLHLLLKSKEQDGTPTPFATELYTTFINPKATQDEILDFTQLLQTMCLSLVRISKESIEALSDFEYLWSYCTATNPAFANAILEVQREVGLSEANASQRRARQAQEERLETFKQTCWKLCCLAEEEQQTKETKSQYVSGRRRRILSTASCLLLVASLAEMSYSPKDTPPENPPVACTDKSRRSTHEEDAIDALSMMLQGKRATSSSSFTPPTTTSESPAPVNVKETIANATNHLLRSIYYSIQTVDKATVPELEHTVLYTVKLLVESNFLPSSSEPSSITEGKASSFVSKLQTMVPTKEMRMALVNTAAIDAGMERHVDKAVAKLDGCSIQQASFDYFPFVDKVRLLVGEPNIISLVCMASSKASSDGVARISQYDGDGIYATQPSRAFAALLSTKPSNRAIRETMELNEWTANILSISQVFPRTRLMLYLEASDDESVKRKRRRKDGVMEEVILGGGWRTVITPLLNRAIGRLIGDISAPGDASTTTQESRVYVSEEDGSVVINGSEDDVDVRLVKALVALYYQSLEAMLYQETARLKSASHPKLIMSQVFHRAVLTCACVCLLKGLSFSSALAIDAKYLDLDLSCIQQITESCPYTYLKVSEPFARALKLYKTSGPNYQSPTVLGLPRVLQRQLSQCEVLVIDSLLWSQDRDYSMDLVVIDIIADIKSLPNKYAGSSWPPQVLEPTLPEEIADAGTRSRFKSELSRARLKPPDHVYFEYIIRKMLKIAFFRITALCNELSIPPEYPVASQVWIAFRYLLREKIELLYDRHVDQLLLCSLYGVCKIMNLEPDLSFSRIIGAYTKVRGSELGERTCNRLFRQIKLSSYLKQSTDERGDIIKFYNILFVPALKNHLLMSKSLKEATKQLQKCMKDPNNRGARHLSLKDCEDLAARADRLANDCGNWANEPSSIRLSQGNVNMNVLIPGSANVGSPSRKKLKRIDVENKTYYTFGSGRQNIPHVNQMAEA